VLVISRPGTDSLFKNGTVSCLHNADCLLGYDTIWFGI
jgi:hypothetical protein